MSVEKPLPEEWIEDLENDIPIQVEEERLEALGFMKESEKGSYEKWIGGTYELDYRAETEEIIDYQLLKKY